MGRFENGWFRLSRRVVFEDIGQNPQCLCLWVWLLSLATVQETKVRWKGGQRVIPPGTVVTGYRDLAQQTGLAATTIVRQLKYLESSERIRIESGTAGTLITICKWWDYQLKHLEDGTQVEHEGNGIAHGSEYAGEHTAAHGSEYTNGTLLNKEQSTTDKEQETKSIAPDLSVDAAVQDPLPIRSVGKPKATKEPPVTAETWKAYSAAFLQRWQVSPKWNATVGGQLANFVKRIGREDAPLVAHFYLSHNDRGYVKNMHPVGWMLKDAEKLYAEWKSGRPITQIQAVTVEKASNYASMLQRIDQGVL